MAKKSIITLIIRGGVNYFHESALLGITHDRAVEIQKTTKARGAPAQK